MSSAQVGYSVEQRRRDTANAPQALAQVAEVARSSPLSQPRRKPDMKASPAPSTLNTSIGKSSADDPGLEIVGDRPVVDDAALRAALEHDGRAGNRPDALQRVEHAVGAAGDHDLLFGADDQVAIGEHGLQPRRHRLRFHVALETRLVAGEPPEVRPVVDVEHHLPAVSPWRARSLWPARRRRPVSRSGFR